MFHSRNRSLLLFVTEALLSLCFPFHWPHIFIPVLPHSLLEVLEAPVPFIVGVHSDELTSSSGPTASPNGVNGSSSTVHTVEELVELHHIVVVDIDRCDIDVSVPPPPFPKAHVRILTRAVRKLIRPGLNSVDRIACPPRLSPESLLRESIDDSGSDALKQKRGGGGGGGQRSIDRLLRIEFLTFMSSLLENYRNCLTFVTPDEALAGHDAINNANRNVQSVPVFNTPQYLEQLHRSHQKEMQHHHNHHLQHQHQHHHHHHHHHHAAANTQSTSFMNSFLQTQIFSDFLNKHVEHPNYLDVSTTACATVRFRS